MKTKLKMLKFKKNQNFMYEAISLARKSGIAGEVPIGALIVDEKGHVLSKSENRIERESSSLAHAELLCISEAIKIKGTSRLINCDLWVTLEPCIMCSGAIINARLRRVYFGAYDTKIGALESNSYVLGLKNTNHKLEIYGGIESKLSEKLLNDFFTSKR